MQTRSRLLEIHADDVIKRERRRFRHKVIFILICTIVVATISGSILWYYTPKKTYYADYIIVNDIPEGIFPLKKDDVRRRESSYRFIEKAEDLIEVDHINSDMEISCEKNPELYDRPPVMKLRYNNYRQLEEITYFDQYDIELMTKVFGSMSINMHPITNFCKYTFNDYLNTYLLYNNSTTYDGLFGLYLNRWSNTPYPKSAISKF